MNVLVTGANGQLGNCMRELAKNSSHNFIFTDVNAPEGLETVFLDITDKDTVSIVAESEKVDVIVNCAAYTNVDKAEDDTAMADLLNRQAPKNLAEVANQIGATLIHISTDYVFPGTACSPIKVNDVPSPVSVYGSTKLAGEKAVLASGCKSIIIRTAWLYSPYGKNFCKTILNLASTRKAIKVVYDQVGSPTYAYDLAQGIMHIINTNQLSKTGIYHFANEGAVSWFDFARAICSIAGCQCKVDPCFSDEYPSRVARPHFSVLDKSAFKNTFGFEIPYWVDSLKECISKLQ